MLRLICVVFVAVLIVALPLCAQPDETQRLIDEADRLHRQAQDYRHQGDYARAEPLYQRALEIRRKVLGEDNADTAESYNYLGRLYAQMGDYDRALPLYEKALAIRRKVLPADDREIAASLQYLGELYQAKRDLDRSRDLFEQALAMDRRGLGADHAETLTVAHNLADVYRERGELASAEAIYRHELAIMDQQHEGGVERSATLQNLALVLTLDDRPAEAEKMFLDALAIARRLLGPKHPSTATIMESLALLYLDEKRPGPALALAKEAQTAEDWTLSNILSFAPEEQRLLYQSTTNPYTLVATMGDPEAIAESVLRHKGVVLDSLLEDRVIAQVSRNPGVKRQLEEVRHGRQRLSQLSLKGQADSPEGQRLTDQVEANEKRMMTEFTRLGRPRRALAITPLQVQQALPPGTALVEFLRYRHYLGRGRAPMRYGALVLSKNLAPRWVSLGSAESIDSLVSTYQKAAPGSASEKRLHAVLRGLADAVWGPTQALFPPATRTVLVSPDGALSFVNFATLLSADDRFLAEKFDIATLASGRDLLRVGSVSRNSTLAIFDAPDYKRAANREASLETDPIATLRSAGGRELESMAFAPLPGTALEGKALEIQAPRWGWIPQRFSAAQATKAQLRSIHSPHVLHLATHGFFLPEVEDQSGLHLKNPMLRSGLALAGAQTTLEAWKRGEVPPTADDGILTAEDVGTLDLEGTWLVTLSACETAQGESRSGEGVLGLRRGFVLAGAQNLLMTLWPVSDETTGPFMLDFYRAAKQSGHAPLSLAAVQRDWLVRLRKERGLGDAVSLAGPFILSFQGKP